jgi:signal transduction histidine kinase
VTLRARLALGIVAIILLLIAPLGLAVLSLQHANADMQHLRTRQFAASLLLGRMRTGLEEVRESELRLSTIPESTWVVSRFTTAIDTLALKADTLSKLGLDLVAQRVESGLSQLRPLGEREWQAVLADQRERTATADSISSNQVHPAIKHIEGAIRNAEVLINVEAERQVETASEMIERSRTAALTAVAAALLLAVGIAIWLTLSISRPVRELERGMRAVAEGQFAHRLDISPRRHDEFGHLSWSFHRMAAQLAQLDKLKAEFVSVASHELKTPINVILGYLQLLQEDVYGPLSPKQREICGTLSAQAQSLSRLVRHLLDVSRFEAGAGRLDPRPMPLAPFLGELESAFRVLALQRGVRFHVERAGEVPETVVWDEDRVNEVLGNLLSNAFKFTERGGTVTLAVIGEPGRVRVDVRDTGAGIPAEHLPHIFEKFFQADNQGSASAKGTGLGLAIAKSIVDAHHGTIAVDSRPGEGTTFSIVLPVQAAPRRSGSGRAQPREEATVS